MTKPSDSERLLNCLFLWLPASCFTLASCAIITVVILDAIPGPPLPLYTSTEVQSVCYILQLASTDEFCSISDAQNADTLLAALNRNYPPLVTTYFDIMPLLDELPSTSTCFMDRLAYPQPCPPPDECENRDSYECYLTFPGSVSVVVIQFDLTTGQVKEYWVARPQDS